MKHENHSLLFIPNKSILYFLGSFQETKTCIHIYFCFFLFTETKTNQTEKLKLYSTLLFHLFLFYLISLSWQSLSPKPGMYPSFLDNCTSTDYQMILGNENFRTTTLAFLSYSPPKSLCCFLSTSEPCYVPGDKSW